MVEEHKKEPYFWWIVLIVVILVGWRVYSNYIPMEDKTFAIDSGHIWYSCWEDKSNIIISYELISDSPVNLYFTPTKQDAENFLSMNVTSINTYPSCHAPNALSDKGDCIISGGGCIVLDNSQETDARVNLKYKAKINTA